MNTAAAQGQAVRPGGAPQLASTAQPQPVPVGARLPAGQLGGSNIFPGSAEIKAKIRTDFGLSFGSDGDFVISKVYSSVAQGFRFRLDRNRTTIKTSIIPISKRGGLLRPGLLSADDTFKPEIAINNILTGKPGITLKETDPKMKIWNVLNMEAGGASVGQVKVVQSGERKIVSFLSNNQELLSFGFRCPVQKTGMCSSAKPADLNKMGFDGKFKCKIELEENPNGDLFKEEFELNVMFDINQPPQLIEYIGLVSALVVCGHELK